MLEFVFLVDYQIIYLALKLENSALFMQIALFDRLSNPIFRWIVIVSNF